MQNTTQSQIVTGTDEGVTTVTAGGVIFAISDNMTYPLTPCCHASATGSDCGTACRGCYSEIDDSYGDCATLDDEAGLKRFVESALDMLGGNNGPTVFTLTQPVIDAIKKAAS